MSSEPNRPNTATLAEVKPDPDVEVVDAVVDNGKPETKSPIEVETRALVDAIKKRFTCLIIHLVS